MNDTHTAIKRAIWRGILPTLLIAGLAGCAGMALTEIAPPVTPAMINPRDNSNSLACGRLIYLTRCARCHIALPVRQYSLVQWERTLPEMSELAKLNTVQSDDLRAYVMAAIRDKNEASEQAEMYYPTNNKAIGE